MSVEVTGQVQKPSSQRRRVRECKAWFQPFAARHFRNKHIGEETNCLAD